MKTPLKRYLLIIPILLFMAYKFTGVMNQHILDLRLFNIEKFLWYNGKEPLTIEIEKHQKNEKDHYKVQINDTTNTPVVERNFTVDNDQYGGGFVKGVQVDTDDDIEILFWSKKGKSYYLDPTPQGIQTKPLKNQTAYVKSLLKIWYQHNIIRPLEEVIYLTLLALYYTLWYLGYRLRKKRNKNGRTL